MATRSNENGIHVLYKLEDQDDPSVVVRGELITEEASAETSYFKGAVGIVAYGLSSVGLVVVNKALYNGLYPYPLIISWFQQIVVTILGVLRITYDRCRGKSAENNFWVLYDDWSKCPWASAFFVCYIGFANLALKLTAVSSYLIARSLTLPVVYLLTVYYLKEAVTPRKKYAVVIIVVSFVIGNLDFSGLTAAGVTLGAISSVSQAIYGIASKVSQSKMQRPDLIVYLLAVWSFIFMIPLVLVLEDYEQAVVDIQTVDSSIYAVILVSSLAGFAINWSVMTIIMHFSVLAYEVTGFAKSAVQPILGVIIFNEALSLVTGLSTFLILVGSFVYAVDIRLTPW